MNVMGQRGVGGGVGGGVGTGGQGEDRRRQVHSFQLRCLPAPSLLGCTSKASGE